MKRTSIAILITLLLSTVMLSAQLKVGDRINGIDIQRLLSSETLTVRPANYKGKKIIFDFWSIYCLSCMKAFATLDSLQSKYQDKIQIVLVNFDSRDSTREIFSRFKNIHRPVNIPLISANEFLRHNFKRDKFPYALWLAEDGTIKYFTGAYNSTEKNIVSFIQNNPLGVDTLSLQQDRYSPLMAVANEDWESRFLFCSYITRWVKGINVGYDNARPINSGNSVRICMNAVSITELCKRAFEERDKYSFNLPYTIELYVTDRPKFLAPADMTKYDEWKRSNAYNYDLIIPVGKKNSVYKRMQSDIQEYFDIDVRIEKRQRQCLVLEKTGPLAAPNTSRLNPDSFLCYRSIPSKFFIQKISDWSAYFPVIDEIDDKLNVIIPYSITSSFDLNKLNRTLMQSNLKLVEASRQVNVLVIRKTKENSTMLFSF
jgi:thiol-disulfide isomerase/thioredoxin